MKSRFILFLLFISTMAFGQKTVDLSALEFHNGKSIFENGDLTISRSSIILLHKFDTHKPDSSQFEKFAYDSGKDETYYLGSKYVHGLLIYDQEMEIQIYCGDYVVIVKNCQTDSILFVKNKTCGIPTFAFDNCGFTPLEYDFTEKKLYYCQTGIFNNSKRKVLKLMELTRNN